MGISIQPTELDGQDLAPQIYTRFGLPVEGHRHFVGCVSSVRVSRYPAAGTKLPIAATFLPGQEVARDARCDVG